MATFIRSRTKATVPSALGDSAQKVHQPQRAPATAILLHISGNDSCRQANSLSAIKIIIAPPCASLHCGRRRRQHGQGDAQIERE